MSTAGVLSSGSSLRAARPALRLLTAFALVAAQFVFMAGPASAVVPTVTVTNAPSPSDLPEPGGTVSYTIGVTNTAGEDLTLISLSSSAFGDLLDAGNAAVSNNTCPAQPTAIATSGTFSCSFDADLVGDPGDPDHVSTVTAQVQNAGLETGSGNADATVSFSDVLPTVSVAKTASVDWVVQPGDTVTYGVVVTNTSPEAVTVNSLSDSVFGDLLDAGNAAVSNNTCPAQPTSVASLGTFSCSFDAALVGNAGDPDHVNMVTAGATDDEANAASAGDSATVSFVDGLPSIAVDKAASVDWVVQPGDTVTYSVDVLNTSLESVTLTALTDDKFGDLLDAGNAAVANNTCPAQPTAIAQDGTFSCTFDADLVGNAGDPDHVNTVTATVEDVDTNPASANDDATVEFVDGLPTITVAKTPSDDAVAAPGDTVTYTVEVTNTSLEDVTLTSLTDDKFGNLLDAGNAAVSNNTCLSQSTAIAMSAKFTCTFDADLVGETGDPAHVNTVTAIVEDVDTNTATAADDATVAFGVFGTLGGFIFEDEDGDGYKDPNEDGIADIGVLITDEAGGEYVAVSNDSGAWMEEIPVGAIDIEVDAATVPDGYVLTTDNDTQTIDLTKTGAAAEAIGYQTAPAALSGTVFVDLDGDRKQTYPEPGLEGITVYLYDGAGALVTSTTTDADGYFAFDEVEPGDYSIDLDTAGLPDGIVIAPENKAIEPGEDKVEDLVVKGTGSIGSVVWHDADGDGVFDDDEEPMKNISVDLIWAGFDGEFGTSDDWVFSPAITDEDGVWSFEDLPPGEYMGAVDLDSVGDGMEATTPLGFEVQLAADEDFVPDDVGFEPSDEALPQTGLGTTGMGVTGLLFLTLGGGLIVSARIVEARRRRLLLSRLFWR